MNIAFPDGASVNGVDSGGIVQCSKRYLQLDSISVVYEIASASGADHGCKQDSLFECTIWMGMTNGGNEESSFTHCRGFR